MKKKNINQKNTPHFVLSCQNGRHVTSLALEKHHKSLYLEEIKLIIKRKKRNK